MFTVVSRWEYEPARESEVMAKADETLDKMRGWAGIEEAYNVLVAPGAVLAIVTYTDEPTYQKLIKDPNGPFESLLSENNLESMTTWIWSESGRRV
ncbi:MAG: hypothetical protein JNK63_03815 [Chthonomonas sp.]|nr:hypothetical protein [Chthonomonas sp.]